MYARAVFLVADALLELKFYTRTLVIFGLQQNKRFFWLSESAPTGELS